MVFGLRKTRKKKKPEKRKGIFEGEEEGERLEKVRRRLEKKGLRKPRDKNKKEKKAKKKTKRKKRNAGRDIAFIKEELGITRSLRPKIPKAKERSFEGLFLKGSKK
jgi:hypothetical protein